MYFGSERVAKKKKNLENRANAISVKQNTSGNAIRAGWASLIKNLIRPGARLQKRKKRTDFFFFFGLLYARVASRYSSNFFYLLKNFPLHVKKREGGGEGGRRALAPFLQS